MSNLDYDKEDGIIRKVLKTDWQVIREPKMPGLQKKWVKRVTTRGKQTSLELPGLGENKWHNVVQYLSKFESTVVGKTQADVVAALENANDNKIEVYVYYKSMNVEQDVYDEPLGFLIMKRSDGMTYAPTLEYISVNPYWQNDTKIINQLIGIFGTRSNALVPTAKFTVANVLNTNYVRTFFLQRGFRYITPKDVNVPTLDNSKEKEPKIFISMIYLVPEPAIIENPQYPRRALAEAQFSVRNEHSDWVAKTLERLSLHNTAATCQSSRTCPKAGQ